jgi:hypothetical protein
VPDRKIKEYVELDRDREWAYLSRYYEVASRFYGATDRVVSEEEIQDRIRAFKEKPASKLRRTLPLREWRFTMDEPDEGVRREYHSFACPDDAWEKVRAPHSVNHVPPDPIRFGSTPYRILAPEPGQRWDIWKADYATWYRTRVPVGKLAAGEVAYLSFDSVNLTTDVWVNEMPVMMGHQALFPFRMDVTEEMGWGEGEDSLIALRVKGTANNTPYLFSDGLQVAYGRPPWVGRDVKDTDWHDESWTGIAGDATLSVMSRAHIEDAFLRTERAGEKKASIRCRVELRNENPDRFQGSVRVEISEWLPRDGEARTACTREAAVLPMQDSVAELSFTVESPKLWSVESPNLYLAHVVLTDSAGRDIDDLYETFGIRTIEMKGSAFLLNGKRVVPRGTHDLANYFGDSQICPSDRSIVMDILLHRKMGATCSRWPSDIRMHYPRIAEYADQIGFMISWTGYFEMWTVHPDMEMLARRDARALVRSLRNRPSIIVWEMGDEPLMTIHDRRRLAWYELVYRIVEAEDTSRPIIPAGWWANELVEFAARHREKGASWEQARRGALEDYPVFRLPLAPWDFHHCPYLPSPRGPIPTYEKIRQVRDALGGERATIFTEFGIDGMPRPQNVESLYGGLRWSAPAIMPIERAKKDLNYYGRTLGSEDWKESQAAQALLLSCMIGQLREEPAAFAGYYFPTLVDAWNFYWGAVDAAFNAKLAWFAVRGCYAEVYVTALHGSAEHPRSVPLDITAGSHGEEVRAATLRLVVKNDKDEAVLERDIAGITVPGGAGVRDVGQLDVSALPVGLYSMELALRDGKGTVRAHRVELFYLADGKA